MILYQKLWDKKGPTNQYVKAIEELAELQHEICKVILEKEQPYTENFIQELVDASIMLEQIYCTMSDEEKQLCEKIKIKKLERIECIINGNV